jgi:hypothetical protein
VYRTRSQGSQWSGLAYVMFFHVAATGLHWTHSLTSFMRLTMRPGTLHAATCAPRQLVARFHRRTVMPMHKLLQLQYDIVTNVLFGHVAWSLNQGPGHRLTSDVSCLLAPDQVM